MANSPIDSLLQLTVPSRVPIDLAPPATSQATLFDKHFNQAAQTTSSHVPARSESDRNDHDDSDRADPYGASNHSALPDDTHYQANAQSDPPAKTAQGDSTKDPQEEQTAVEDEVEISSEAATPSVDAAQNSKTNLQLLSAAETADDESAEEDSAQASNETAHTNTEETANQSNPQAVSHVEEPEQRKTSTQPDSELLTNTERPLYPESPLNTESPLNPELSSNPELTEELNAIAIGQQATSTHTRSTDNAGSEVQLTTRQDAAEEQAVHLSDSSHPTDLQSEEDSESDEHFPPPEANRPTKRVREATVDADASDRFSSKEHQITATTKPTVVGESGLSAGQSHDTESASAGKPVATAEASVSPTTNSVPSTEVVDRALDRLAAPRSIQPAGQTSLPTVDRARFVGRVSSALRLAQQRDGQLQLRLSPPELGSLRLEISVKQGVLTASIETETAAARQVLLENLPALRERLAGLEIRIEQFDVDVRQEGGEQTQQRATQERSGEQAEGRQKFSGQHTDQRERTERSTQSVTPGVIQVNPDGLDVVI
jgi:flagellar hook-length control protein FliK